MAKTVTPKKLKVKLVRSIYVNGTQVKAKNGKTQTVIELPAQLATELVANSKAVLTDEKVTTSAPEKKDTDDLADE